MDPPPPPPPPPRRPSSSNHPAFVFSSTQQRSDVGHGINFNNNNQNNEINSISHSCYIRDYDTNWIDFDFQNFQPPFASLELINPSALQYRGGNLRSEYYSQFGSRIMNGNHVSRPADQENFPRHHGTRRSLQFGTGSSPYMGIVPTPMLTTSNNRSGFRGPSYDNTNIGASSSSFVQSNNGTNYSINQMAANPLRMNGTSQERKVIRERNTDLVDLETSSIADVARETRSLPNPNHSESQALVVASPTPSHPIDSTEPISGPTQASPAEQVIVPCNGNMPRLPDANLVEELNQGRPRSERPQSTSGKDGINRRCQCKSSQCLKLYCDCFAVGLPCLDSCTCQNCENTSASAPKVQDARKKIESRNPLAFAPKVTDEGTGSPANIMEDGTVSNRSSLRHRTGCNCNKSKCVKKYCECYKGNAGCSFDCRCVNCENSFGRRPVITYTSAQIGVAPSNTNTVSGRETQSNNHENGNTDQFPSGEGLPVVSHYTASLQPSPIPESIPHVENSPWNLGTHFRLPPVTILPNGNPSPDQHCHYLDGQN